MPLSELRDDAREQSERTHANANGDRDLVRVKTLGCFLGRGCSLGAHNKDNASGRSANTPDLRGGLAPVLISRNGRGRVREREWQEP